jgi:hypothetical protein
MFVSRMAKRKVLYLLDFIPLVVLTISAIVLVWTVISTEHGFFWKHFVGLCFLPIIWFAFYLRHKIGVLVLCLTLLLGLFGLLSCIVAVTIST